MLVLSIYPPRFSECWLLPLTVLFISHWDEPDPDLAGKSEPNLLAKMACTHRPWIQRLMNALTSEGGIIGEAVRQVNFSDPAQR